MSINETMNLIKSFFTETSSTDTSFISSAEDIGFESVWNLLTNTFVFAFFGYEATYSGVSKYYILGFRFREFNAFHICYLIFMLSAFVYCLILIAKNKNWTALPFICTLAVEYVLHLFFGNKEMILYIIKITFLVLILMYIGLTSKEISLKI